MKSTLYRPLGVRPNTIREWDRESGEYVYSIQSYSGLHIVGCSFKNAIFASPALKTIVWQYGGVIFPTS